MEENLLLSNMLNSAILKELKRINRRERFKSFLTFTYVGACLAVFAYIVLPKEYTITPIEK